MEIDLGVIVGYILMTLIFGIFGFFAMLLYHMDQKGLAVLVIFFWAIFVFL